MLNLMEGIIPEYDRKGKVCPFITLYVRPLLIIHRSVVLQALRSLV